MSETTARCFGVLPAAGSGSRMGETTPKQYLNIAGASVLEHSLNALLKGDRFVAVSVPLAEDDHRARQIALLSDSRVRLTQGAAQRSGSVLAGLEALAGEAAEQDWVVVHDAARPCLLATDRDRLIETVCDSGVGGLLAEPIADTVKQVDAQRRVSATLDRSLLWRAQSPQMFRYGELKRALLAAESAGTPVTDEASAMEAAGYPVQIVPSSSENLKITWAADLSLAGWYLERRQ
ncbi:MAG: 2-C-methyl-D-erythritol 4-phosphate cytidylyltransferase [Pseudomonadota bacterium]